MAAPILPGKAPVPWRTIVASVAVVAGALLLFVLLRETTRIIAWIVVAGFFAVVLAPGVDAVQRRTRMRRGVATSVVFFTVVVALIGMLAAFVVPIVDQGRKFLDDLPGYIEDAQEGEGPVGDLIERWDLQDWVEENRDRVEETVTGAGAPALAALRSVFNTVLALLTILVLTFLMILRGPQMSRGALNLVAPPHRDRVRLVAADAAKAVSGYMLGNVLISLAAGLSTYVLLRILGVPYPEVIALFVAFADMIPLIGATMGAIPTVGLAFIHSVTAGVVTLIFYVVYQQFENHILQPTIMSRTVDVNPLAVLVSVLVGVELFGFLGALLAIPAAGIIQVILRNVYDPTTGRFKREPTVGEDEVPVSDAEGNA